MEIRESSTDAGRYRSRAVAIAWAIVIASTLPAGLGAIDLIDAGQLGDRGVTILGPDAPWAGENLLDACGFGDVDGDGLDDLLVIEMVAVDETIPPTSTTTTAVLVFGDASLRGT